MNTAMPLNLNALETSFDLVAPRGDELMDEFYSRLFAAAPAVKPLFPDDLRRQKTMLLAALVLVRKSLRDLDAIAPTLRRLGARHVAYGAKPEHYPLVGTALIAAMATIAGDAWTPEYARPWRRGLRARRRHHARRRRAGHDRRPRPCQAPDSASDGKRPRRLTGQHRPAHANTKERQMPCATHTYRASAAARRGCPHT
jgi:hemoglobin-like flavoprotein